MKKIILSTLLLCIILLIDLYYGANTYQISVDMTEYLQHAFSYGDENGIIESILLIISIFGKKIFIWFLILLLWLKSGQKEQILKILSMYCLSSFFVNFLNLILIQPRPFYIYEEVRLDFCQLGFGDPADVSLRTIVFYVLLSETLLFKKYKIWHQSDLGVFSQINTISQSQQKQLSNYDLYSHLYPNSLLTYTQYNYLLGLFIFLQGFAQAYFGLNFINQIIIGWIVGIYILYLYYYCNLERFLDQKFCQAIYNKQESLQQQLREYFKLGSFLIIIMILSFFLYYIDISNTTIDQLKKEWFINFTNQKQCTNIIDLFIRSFERSNIMGTSIIFWPLYLFIFCQYTYGSYKPELYDHNFFSLKGCFRGLILILIMITQIEIQISLRNFIKVNEINIVLYYILFGQLSQAFSSFLLISIVPYCYKLLRLDLEGDLFRKVTQIEQQEMEL